MFFLTGGRTGRTGMLERALMDGAEREVLVSDLTEEAQGLAVDPSTRQVYWTEKEVIWSSDYDGGHKRTVRRLTGVGSLPGLTVFQNRLYLSAWKVSAIISVDKFRSSNLTV